jgi:hypothetical protein
MTDASEIQSLSPVQATARLAEMEAARRPVVADKPSTPNEARARLNALSSDKEWGAKFVSGDADAHQEFKGLTELSARADAETDRIDAVLDGKAAVPMFETTTDGELPTRHLVSAVDGLRELGISDGAVRQALEGDKVTRAEHEMAKHHREAMHSNPDWVKKFLAGEHGARRESLLLSIILSSDVEGS